MRFECLRFHTVAGAPEPGRYKRIVYIDHRGGPQLRVNHAMLAVAKKLDLSIPVNRSWFGDAYRNWLKASVVLYPLFWRQLVTNGETCFACDCGLKHCPLNFLAQWLESMGSKRIIDVAQL